MFASFDTICRAADVCVGEAVGATAPSSFPVCSRHYYTVHSFCRTDVECALCGSKRRHRATIDRSLPLRPVPQPQSIV